MRRRSAIEREVDQAKQDSERRRLELQREFESRRHQAVIQRLNLDQGPQLRLKWFESVTWKQRWEDRLRALWDSLRRIHRFADCIRAYDRMLCDEIQVARLSMRVNRVNVNAIETGKTNFEDLAPSPDGKDQLIKYRRSEVALAKVELENLQKAEEEVGTTYFNSLEASLKIRLAEETTILKAWSDILGRPSYHDRLADLKDWLKIKTDGVADQPVHTTSWWRKWIQNKVAAALNVLPFILIPLEAVFALPAFQFLTPDSQAAAVAGALVFTGLLMLLGHAFAMFAIRGLPNHLDMASKSYRTIYRPRPLAVAALLLFTGGWLAVGGADLRSKLPLIEILSTKTQTLEHRRDELNDQAIHDHDGTSAKSIIAAVEKIKKEQSALDESRHELLKIDYRIGNSDEFVALFVYLAMFISAAVRVTLSRDIIFEYELATITVREIEKALNDIDFIRETERRYWRGMIHTARNELAKKQAQLGIVSPNDPLAIPEPMPERKDPAITAPETSKPEATADATKAAVSTTDTPAEERKSANLAIDAFEKNSVGWRRNRVRRYATWYACLFGEGIKTFAESRSRALAYETIE